MKLSHNLLIYIFLCLVLIILVPLIQNLFFYKNPVHGYVEEPKKLPETPEIQKKKQEKKPPISFAQLKKHQSYRAVLKSYTDAKLDSLARKNLNNDLFEIHLVADKTFSVRNPNLEVVTFRKLSKHPGLYRLSRINRSDNIDSLIYFAPNGNYRVVFLDKKVGNTTESHSLSIHPAYYGKDKGEYEEETVGDITHCYYFLGRSWCYMVTIRK